MYATGVVKSFISEKGFGFIETKKGEKNVFFHISKGKKIKQLEKDAVVFSDFKKETRVPIVGDRLVFESAQGEKGLFAVSWGFLESTETALRPTGEREMKLPATAKKIAVLIEDTSAAHGGKTMRQRSVVQTKQYKKKRRRIKDLGDDDSKNWKNDF